MTAGGNVPRPQYPPPPDDPRLDDADMVRRREQDRMYEAHLRNSTLATIGVVLIVWALLMWLLNVPLPQ